MNNEVLRKIERKGHQKEVTDTWNTTKRACDVHRVYRLMTRKTANYLLKLVLVNVKSEWNG